MIKLFSAFTMMFLFAAAAGAQDAPLPAIAVKNVNNKIIVSWVNDYTRPLTTLNIQRSYDSLQNFSTIGSVLSPQSKENGFVDANPPYNKMYYRVFAAFEGGSYVITASARPVKDTASGGQISERFPWIAIPGESDSKPLNPTSSRVFATRDNNVVIHLPDAQSKKYTIKFFDEAEKLLFELTRLQEEYLIIEKVNFVRPGWFRFEIYESGTRIESNRFQIVKEAKKL